MNDYSDFAATYKQMSDGQLLKIANDGGLLEEASVALAQELKRRNLKTSDVQFHQESLSEKLQKEVKERWFPLSNHVGFALYGRTYLNQSDRMQNIQTRTKFFVLGIPLIPIASYRLRCKSVRSRWFQTDLDGKVLNRVPLLWTQVVMTWIKTILFVAAICCLVALARWIWRFSF